MWKSKLRQWVGQDAWRYLLLLKGVTGDFEGRLHRYGSRSSTNRHGGSALAGKNGYQAWAIMSPYGSVEIVGTYWYVVLKLIHLDHGCTACVCLGAWGSRGYWQSRRTPWVLQRAQVISMLSLPFETWFSYSLSAKVTRLGETAGRLAAMESHFKAFSSRISLPLCVFSLPRSVFFLGPGEKEGECGWFGEAEGGAAGVVVARSLE